MGRSGTSLVQEIMITYPGFCNLGESKFEDGRFSCYMPVRKNNDFTYLEEVITKRWTKEFFVEKTPDSILCLPQLAQRYPDANYLFVERHPLKIVLSRMNFHPPGLDDETKRYNDFINLMVSESDLGLNYEQHRAKQVLDMIKSQITYKHLFKNQMTIRYEDLVKDLDLQLIRISQKFNDLVPNFKKARKTLSRPAYSSKNNRHDITELTDPEAIRMIKEACVLWHYDYLSLPSVERQTSQIMLLNVSLDEHNYYNRASKKLAVIPGYKYEVNTIATGIKGEPFSAYFGAILFDKEGKEIERKIRWLNDFSGVEKEYSLIFQAPQTCDHLKLIYKINSQTPEVSSCEFRLLSLEEVKTIVVDDKNVDEDYDSPNEYPIPLVNELTAEEELQLEQNLVWILAAPRSGTTWLATQLLSYETLCWNEPFIGRHLGIGSHNEHSYVREIDLSRSRPNYVFSLKYANTWKFFLRKFILNRIHAQFNNLHKKIIIKEPNGSMAADIISDCFPKSRIIVIQRDGRDIIDSQVDALKKGAWGTEKRKREPLPEKNRLNYIANQSRWWNLIMKSCLKAYNNYNPDNRFLAKYEDLRSNTFEVLKQMYRFIEIPITDDEIHEIADKYSFEKIPASQKGSGKFARSASPGKWKDHFNKEEQDLMHGLMGSMLKKLEYTIE